MANKPITPEEMKAYIDATWEKCQTEAWQEPRQWQGLTDEDRDEILRWIEWKEIGSQPVAPQKLIAYVDKKLKEKNT